MAVHQQPSEAQYSCPACGGSLRREHRTWQCGECGYAPKHGAD